jgi:hypothetical protein
MPIFELASPIINEVVISNPTRPTTGLGHLRPGQPALPTIGCPLHSKSDLIVSRTRNDVWTAPGWQGESSRCSIGRSSHVFGLFARYS